MALTVYHELLETLYERYTRREYVHPDPLEFVHRCHGRADREVAGLVASCLAYGRVSQILRSVQTVLNVLGPRPASGLMESSDQSLRRRLKAFRHRFTTGAQMAELLGGARRLLERYGTLEACFASFVGEQDRTVLPAMDKFVGELTAAAGMGPTYLLPSPSRGSACKRLNLLLRWMVRKDAVDCGVWTTVSAALLVVPLDTHMFQVGRALGAIRRRSVDLRAAMELTDAFRAVCPDDPARYDFALTRPGIRKDTSARELLLNAAKLRNGDG